MRKSMKCITALFLLTALLLPALAGCKKADFNASKAVDAYLAVETKGEFDLYAEMTGKNKEILKAQYDAALLGLKGMFQELEYLGVSFGDDFIEELKNLMASGKYQVIGHQKEDGDYVVDVDVFPSDVLDLFFSNIMTEALTMGDMNDMGTVLIEALQTAIAYQTYGDPISRQVRVSYNKDTKDYEINQEDIQKILGDFYSMEGVMEDLLDLYEPSGTVYDNPYLNWSAEEWNAASEEEKTQCCLSLVQELYGFSDEEMASIDLNSTDAQTGLQAIKDGLDMNFQGLGAQMKIGDYMEFLRTQMGFY